METKNAKMIIKEKAINDIQELDSIEKATGNLNKAKAKKHE